MGFVGKHFTSSSTNYTPWSTGQSYIVDQIVTYNKIAYICSSAHTSSSFESDVSNGKWTVLNTTTIKNYMLTGHTFENANTLSWELKNSTLDATTKLPNQSYASLTSASSALTFSTTTSGNQISGVYSGQLTYTQSSGNTSLPAGNMLLSQAYKIDVADQSKVLSIRFNYKNIQGSTTPNFSGTSSNTFGVAIYVVDGASAGTWIQPAGVFNLVQTSGVGTCNGTFQTPSDMTQFRLAIYCANALTVSTGVYSLIVDDFYVGPQPFSMGPAMSDWVSYTPTFTGFGSVSNITFFSRRVGDSLEVHGFFTSGTPTAVANQISLGYNGANSNVTVDLNKTGSAQLLGTAGTTTATSSAFTWNVLGPNSSGQSFFQLGYQSSTTSSLSSSQLGTALGISNGTAVEMWGLFPITGWASNTIQSADSDQRVVSLSRIANVQYTVPSTTYVTLDFGQNVIDTHSGWRSGVGYNSATGTWTTPPGYVVPVSGYYYASVATVFPAGANGRQLFLARNLSNFVGTANDVTATASTTLNTNGMLYCNAGDLISVAVFQNSGGSLGIPGSLAFFWSSIQIQRLSGPAVVQATETVGCTYNSLGANTVSSSGIDLIFTTKEFDTHAAYSTSTGEYTVPVSGLYTIDAAYRTLSTAMTIGHGTSLFIRIDGAIVKYIQNLRTQATNSIIREVFGIPVTLRLNAGQKIKLGASSDTNAAIDTSTSPSQFNYVSIVKTGN